MTFSTRDDHSAGTPSKSAVILGVLALLLAGAISAGMVIGAFAFVTSGSERGSSTVSAPVPDAGLPAATITDGPEPASTASGETPGSSGAAAQTDAAVESADAIVLTEATVVRVVDGDTAVFRLEGGATEKTRFIGIDTPESTNSIEEYGREAAAYTKRAL